MAEDTNPELTALAADIVSAYVSKNNVPADKLGEVIHSVHTALSTAGSLTPSEPETPKPDKAAIRKSQHPDHLTSFIDGRKYKSLKRHLSGNGMTPAEYREKYGLAKDYPMVAPSYSAQRSELAKSLGLGRKAAAASPAAKAPTKGSAKGGKAENAVPIAPEEESFT